MRTLEKLYNKTFYLPRELNQMTSTKDSHQHHDASKVVYLYSSDKYKVSEELQSNVPDSPKNTEGSELTEKSPTTCTRHRPGHEPAHSLDNNHHHCHHPRSSGHHHDRLMSLIRHGPGENAAVYPVNSEDEAENIQLHSEVNHQSSNGSIQNLDSQHNERHIDDSFDNIETMQDSGEYLGSIKNRYQHVVTPPVPEAYHVGTHPLPGSVVRDTITVGSSQRHIRDSLRHGLKACGVIHAVIGTILLGMGIAGDVLQIQYAYIGHGFWTGMFVVVTGVLTITVAYKDNGFMIVFTFIWTILSTIATGFCISVCFSSILFFTQGYCELYESCTESFQNDTYSINGAIIAISVLEIPVAFISTIFVTVFVDWDRTHNPDYLDV